MARSTSVFAVAVLLLGLAVASEAAFCHGKPHADAKPNMYPLLNPTPKLMRTAPNGKAYQVNEGGLSFWVLHVYGTPYEMGYAHGQMMKAEAQVMVNQTMEYIYSQAEQALAGLPTWLRDWVAEVGVDIALDWTANVTAPYTGDYFFEEMRGLADGAGVDYQDVLRIHMIGELTQGDCSMYGAWGSATMSTNHTYQLRALDWDVQGPFRDYPAVVVYHPSNEGHDFANVGFIGWIGALTGQSAKNMAISEIGVSFPDKTFGKESRIGIPFTFLLRDILQFDNTYEDSISRIKNAHRTCDLILGVGDGKASTFRGFQYSASVATVVDSTNLIPVNSTWHQPIADVVYWGMDWLCPAYNLALQNQLKKWHGNITVENTVRDIVSIVQTGNLHAAVYDLTTQEMSVSFCKKSTDKSDAPMYSYDRQFTTLNLDTLFSEPAPTVQDLVDCSIFTC